ncbi:MAG: hypothetical protein KDD59_11780 [Bdellovibrionales bacterium]|nr:hypothetical protein [Bdellovibrionales bacterium]
MERVLQTKKIWVPRVRDLFVFLALLLPLKTHGTPIPSPKEIICSALLSGDESPERARFLNAYEELFPQINEYNRILQNQRYLTYELAVASVAARPKNWMAMLSRISDKNPNIKKLKNRIHRSAQLLERARPFVNSTEQQIQNIVSTWLMEDVPDFRSNHWNIKHLSYLSEKTLALSEKLNRVSKHASNVLKKMPLMNLPEIRLSEEHQERLSTTQSHFVRLLTIAEKKGAHNIETEELVEYLEQTLWSLEGLSEELMLGVRTNSPGESYSRIRSVTIGLQFLQQQADQLLGELNQSIEKLNQKQQKFLCATLELCADYAPSLK